MAEYIERSKIFSVWRSMPAPASIESLATAIHQTPAADVEPVKRGCWSLRCDSRKDFSTGEYDEDFYLECSECKRKVWDIDQSLAVLGEWGKLVEQYPYCHCGARMDGERRETNA